VGVLVICILYSEVFLNLTEIFLTLNEVLPCFFLSCKANARVKLTKTGHGPHSFTLVVVCLVRLIFVLFYVLFVCKCVLPPGENSIAVNKHIIYSKCNTLAERYLSVFLRLWEHSLKLYGFRRKFSNHGDMNRHDTEKGDY
jgi:hypothetical protein